MAKGKSGTLILEVENFVPIKRAKLEVKVPGLTVVTGNNGSGKTRLIAALYFMNTLLSKYSGIRSKGSASAIKREIRYYLIPSHFPWVKARGELDYSRLFLDPSEPLRLSLRYVNRDEVGELSLELTSRKELTVSIDVSEMFHIPMHVIGPYRSLLSSCQCPFEFPQMYVDYVTELREGISQMSEPLKISLDVFDERPEVIVYENGSVKFVVNGKEFPLPSVASGWAESWALFAYMKIAKAPPRLIALEEPESHLHPSALMSLVRKIVSWVSEGYSFLVTTHSPLFSAIMSLIIVKKEDVGGELVRWYELVKEEGITLRRVNVTEVGVYDELIEFVNKVVGNYLVAAIAKGQ